MTILRKGKARIRLFSVICFRAVRTLLLTEECISGLMRYVWNFIRKDLEAEAKVEAVLDAAEIFYNKSEVWIPSERLYEVLFSFMMEG